MKRVRVTLELPESFVRLLGANAQLSRWTDWDPSAADDVVPPELSAGEIVAWLVLMEARGAHEQQIHAATPMVWRQAGGPEVIHSERRVIEDKAKKVR